MAEFREVILPVFERDGNGLYKGIYLDRLSMKITLLECQNKDRIILGFLSILLPWQSRCKN
jgi:hypothetical protein